MKGYAVTGPLLRSMEPRRWERFDFAPLTWTRTRTWGGPVIFLVCANGHLMRLDTLDHAVAIDGRVTPAVVCPVKGCGFHRVVTLEGWGRSDAAL